MVYVLALLLVASIVILNTFLGGGAKREQREKFYGYYYADEGVTSPDDVPNSRRAFEKCAEAGLGIKAGIIMSADKKIFVANRYSLLEDYGVDRMASACTGEELEEIGLLPFAELLEIAGKKSPVIAEIKVPEDYRAMCRAVADAIYATNRTNIAVTCFAPGVIAWFKHTEKPIMRSIISAPSQDFKSLSKTEAFLTGNLAYNATCRPQIILYRNKPESFLVRLSNNLGGMSGVWDIKTPEEGKAVEEAKDVIVFRGFMPETPRYKYIVDRELSQAEEKENARLEKKAEAKEAREKYKEEREAEKLEKKTGVAQTPASRKAKYLYDDEEFGNSGDAEISQTEPVGEE